MAFEFELPDVGEGIAEGEIVAWHVSPGDTVEEDQVMADVETDKAVVDLPAPVTGTVVELHAEEGEMVPVGTVVATIEVEGEVDEADIDVDAGDEPVTDASEEAAAKEAAETGDGEVAQDAVEASTGDGRVFAPPNVRRLAREEAVDITAVEGTGPSGRITEADVRAAAESGTDGESEEKATKSAVTRRTDDQSADAQTSQTAAQAGTQMTASAETADRERTLATPATRGLAREEGVDIDEVPTEKTRDGEAFVEEADVRAFVEAQEAAAAGAQAAGAGTEAAGAAGAGTQTATPTPEDPVTTEPYRGIRRTIGKQMQESAFTAPHAHHHDTADVSALVATREKLKARAEEQGIKLTYMPFVMKAIVAGLKEFPMLNSELDEENEEIRYKNYYNIGIAVATEAGLMVPVVKNVDQKSVLQLASEVNELAAKARDRKVTPEEMQDGTFTITNFGAFGGEYATPIINHPESAILGLGAIEERPVVEDGEVVPRHTLPLSLAIDHRVIDGAEGAQFTNTVMKYLETPELLLLE